MAARIRRVDYYSTIVSDRPGAAYQLLTQMAKAEVNLLAFNAIPMGMDKTQLVLFPEHVGKLARVAEQEGLHLTGPQHALLIQGDDELGVLVGLHRQLAEAQINVLSSSCLTDGRGGYAYLIFVRNEDYENAARALGV